MNKTKKINLQAGMVEDAAIRVDRESKTIFGVRVAEIGDLVGWNLILSDIALDTIVELGLSNTDGVRSRFGHPEYGNSAPGSFLGRFSNFVKDGTVVRADLSLSDTAFNTPTGDIASYVMDLAEKDPKAFGSSMAVDGYETENREFIVVELSAIDIVDSPAIGLGLFAERGSDDEEKGLLKKMYDKLFSNEVNQNNKENSDMEYADVTLEGVKEHCADVVQALLSEGIAEERKRIASIMENASPMHFAASEEHPEGLVQEILLSDVSVIEGFTKLLKFDSKKYHLAEQVRESAFQKIDGAPTEGEVDVPGEGSTEEISESARFMRQSNEKHFAKAE